MFESWIVVASEIALALYPILIKRVSTGLTTQLLSRFLSFSVLAAVLAKSGAIQKTWGTSGGLLRSGGLGLITLGHVAASYIAFDRLPAGVSMSLFYTYPFFNLIGGWLGYGETISAYQILLMVVAFAGVLLVSFGSRHEEEEGKPVDWKGIGAALMAALTETAMYFAVRTAKVPDPYYATLELYPGALFGLLGLLAVKAPVVESIDTRSSVWIPMLLFNGLIGFVGYAMRFWAIPKVSTALFSILSFVGVAAAFGWGWLFVEEKPTWMTLAGAGLIAAASGLAEKKES